MSVKEKTRKSAMCADHPQSPAIARCVACHKHLCQVCRVEIAHHPYCPVCARQVVEESVSLAVVKGEAAHERRRFPRVSTVIPARYIIENQPPVDAVLVNINMGGSGIVTHQRLAEESQVMLWFTLPNQTKELQVQAGVMHTKNMNVSFFYSGVIFMNMGANAKWVEDFLRQRTTKQFVKLDKVSFV